MDPSMRRPICMNVFLGHLQYCSQVQNTHYPQSNENNNNQRRKSKRFATKAQDRLADDKADEADTTISFICSIIC